MGTDGQGGERRLDDSTNSTTNTTDLIIEDLIIEADQVAFEVAAPPFMGEPGYHGVGCFSRDDTVTLRGGSAKPLSRVQVGDEILTATSSGRLEYSPVIYLPHPVGNKHRATFLEFALNGSSIPDYEHHHTIKKSIRLTPDHLVLTIDCGILQGKPSSLDHHHLVTRSRLKMAGEVDPASECLLLATISGDGLPQDPVDVRLERILSVTSVVMEGVFTAMTKNSFLVSLPVKRTGRESGDG